MIYFYEGKYYLFSNWSAHQVLFKGILYPTAEHAYHSQRFDNENIRSKIRKAISPFLAKKIAHDEKVKQRSSWNEEKISVMYEVLKAKLNQHQDIQDVLFKTQGEEIIEDSPIDFFWGCGKDKSGQNQLGKLWMKLRLEYMQK